MINPVDIDLTNIRQPGDLVVLTTSGREGWFFFCSDPEDDRSQGLLIEEPVIIGLVIAVRRFFTEDKEDDYIFWHYVMTNSGTGWTLMTTTTSKIND